MFTKSFLFLLLTLLAYTAIAQHSVTGKLKDAAFDFPLEGAQVELIQLPDSIKKSLYADEEGSFQFQNVSPSKYVLKISSLGYTTIKKRIEVTNEDLNLGTIKLQEKSETLEEVQIKGEIPPVTQMDDTTQYNAGSYKVNPDATAEDLVRKMPGVTMEGGEVKVQGEKVTRVLVDGKVFFGEDANTVLKNLPADMIDKVQVYDQGSEQAQFTGFDDGQTTKTINLITKPHMRNGKFGRVYGGYGTQDRYQAGGNINMFNGNRRLSLIGMSNNINVQNFSSQDLLGVAGGESGSRRGGRGNRFSAGSDARDFQIGAQNGITRTNAFGLNYMDKWGEKTEVVGSYFFNMTDNIENSFLNREYVFPSDSIQRYNERSMNTSQNINHRANLRINITLDTMTSLLILPSISLQQNSGLSNTSGQNRLNGLMLNETDNSLNTEFLGYNLANDVLFKRRFAKRGRTFSYNLHTGYNRNEGESFLYAENMFFRGLIDSDTIDQQSLLQQNGWNASGNAVYTEPIGKKSQVQLEHHISHQDNESDKRTFLFYPPEMGYTVLDTNLSNIFANTYTTNRLGTAYKYRSEKIRFNLRMSVENAILNSDREFPNPGEFRRTFNNILPSAMFRYNYSKTKNLRVYYRTYTRPPSVNQLQNVLNNTNPLKLYMGNPDLDQEYSHRLFLRYTSTNPETSRNFYAYVSGIYMNNQITNSTFIAGQDTLLAGGILLPRGAQLIQPVNMAGHYTINSFANYSLPVKKLKSNLNLNASAGHSRNPGLINNNINYSYVNNLGLGAVLASNISKNLDFTLSSRSNYNFVENTLREDMNTQFFNQVTHFRFNYIFWKNLVFRSDLNHQYFSGLAPGFNQSFFLWNLSVGKKIFKDQRGEIFLSVYDVLGQNNNIHRNVTETYIQDVQTNVLQRYFMLNFSYNLKSFKGAGLPDSE